MPQKLEKVVIKTLFRDELWKGAVFVKYLSIFEKEYQNGRLK